MFLLFLPRTLLGAHTDPSIDVSDPISETFYKEVWMTISARNATIYEKVTAVYTLLSLCFLSAQWWWHYGWVCLSVRVGCVWCVWCGGVEVIITVA